jgi:methylase of polypeptide subunit release factors
MSQDNIESLIQKLIIKYDSEKQAGRINGYSEEETKNVFIKPLFAALGWDFEDKHEVSAEENIKSGGRVDYGFYLDGRIAFYLEAKPLKADINKEEYARQAVNYAWNKGATWAVLTDFEVVILFNAQNTSKNLGDKKVFSITYDKFIDRIDELRLLSKESFKNNGLDEYAQKIGKKLEKISVSELLYKDLDECRQLLTRDLGAWNPEVPKDVLDEGVQKLLDRLIFIRVAEDREIEPKTLIPLLRQWQSQKDKKETLYESMIEKFRELDKRYNSNLFSEHFFEKWEEHSGITEKVINILYGKPGYYEYDFKVIPADVLGAVYESYLGHKLSQSKKKELAIDKDSKKRKEQGIYYTPTHIVDYIIKNALEPVLDECKTMGDISKIKVLDPACGSGSFLIKALDVISEKRDKMMGLKDGDLTKFVTLETNIYGVDLDYQAVEIARLNLLISSLNKQEKMPLLSHNIQNGNSLISGTDEELKKYFGANYRDKKPFNWEKEFPEVFKQGGFDVIIGNPPYISFYSKQAQTNADTEEELDYFRSEYKFIKNKDKLGRFNTVMFFIEKAISLLRDGGVCGFIVDMNLFGNPFADLRDYLLKESKIIKIVTNLTDFQGVGSGQVIIIFQKSGNKLINRSNKIVWQEDVTNLQNNKIIEQSNWMDDKNSFQFKITKNNDADLLSKKIIAKGILDDIYPKKLVRTSITFTGQKDKFLVTSSSLSNHKDANSLIFPLLEGSDGIPDRYSHPRYKNYVNYDEELRDRLNQEYVKLAQKSGKRTPMVIGLGSLQAFKSPKIFVRLSSKKVTATYTDEVLCADLSLYVITDYGENFRSDHNLKYVLSILNSKLVNYFAISNNILRQQKGGMPQMRLGDLKKIPIYKIDFGLKTEKNIYKELIRFSEKMLCLNENLQSIPKDTNKWEEIKKEIEMTDREIDQKVYELYGLTDEEIKIVEGK